jgi:hypothetical protein
MNFNYDCDYDRYYGPSEYDRGYVAGKEDAEKASKPEAVVKVNGSEVFSGRQLRAFVVFRTLARAGTEGLSLVPYVELASIVADGADLPF